MRLSALLLFITSFFSLTFPRSGTKIGGIIPVTIPNILFMVTLFFWCVENIINLKRALTRPGFKSLLGLLIFLYLCWGVVALIRGAVLAHPFNWATMAVALLGYPIIYFLIVSRVKTLTALKLFAGMVAVSLLITCLYGMVQEKLGHFDTLIPGLTMSYADAIDPDIVRLKENLLGGIFTGGRVKMFSTFHNGNLFGQHITTFTPLMIALFFAASSKQMKLYYLLIILLCTIALIYTCSRGAMAGFLGSIFFLLLFSRDKNLKIFMVFILILISLLIPFLGLTWRFVEQTKSAPTGGRLERALEQMASVASLDDIRLGWLSLAGAGIGVTVNGVTAFYNTFLTIFLDLGLIGLLLFFLIIAKLFIFGLKGSRALSQADFLSAFIIGGLAGICGALIHHLVDFLFFLPPIAQNFWMLVGLIAAAIQLKRYGNSY